jgi:hypothetical protein
LEEGVDFGFLERGEVVSSILSRVFVGGSATNIIYQSGQRSIEQVVARQETANVSDRRLEKTHSLIVRTDAPVDVRDVIHNLVDDLREFHDQGG